MHSWLGWQSCSSRSHSSMSAQSETGTHTHTCENVVIVSNHSITYLDREMQCDCWSAADGRSVPLIYTRRPKITHHADSCLLPSCRLMETSPLGFLAASPTLKARQLFSCETFQNSSTVCLPPHGLVHTHTHTDCTRMLPSLPAPAMATCPSQTGYRQ